MNRKHTVLIILITGVLFSFSFLIGYKVINNKANDRLQLTDNTEGNEDLNLEILKEDKRITPNTLIEIKTHYTSCNHNITKFQNASYEIINMTEEEFEEYVINNYSKGKIISFSSKEIVLREERNHLCPNHYIVGESNGYIAIFGIDENGIKYLDKEFKDYPINLLKEIDQEKLINGIIVDSEEELSDVLENFIS